MTNNQDEAVAGPGVDPVTFEVIRHRLWAINDDQGRSAARLSGAPIVFDGYDFNAALLTGDGRGLYTGVYIMHHGATLDFFVQKVLEEWAPEDIHEGDMFFTNDPWWGSLHANDGILAMPIFYDGQLVAWSGIVMHENDVGSPVPGSFVTGAQDRFGEAPLLPAVKMVEGFKVRTDIERIFLRNSRTPDLNELNMRSRIGALRTTHHRIGELIDQYSLAAFLASQEEILRYVERVVRRRLREIPDGSWYSTVYLDHDGAHDTTYLIACRVTKTGDRLICDFTGTADQAPGPINCTRPALEASVVGVMLTTLCYDLPWAVGAVRDIVEIVSEPGTVNNAVSPAAVSLGSIMGTLSSQDVVANAFGKMLLSSERYRAEAQATWAPGLGFGLVLGGDAEGVPFMAVATDCFGGGGGARSYADGVDSGGLLQSMASRIGNVETMESRAPVLQVYRRELRDAGGAGRFRGGVGIEYATIPHKAPFGALTNTSSSGVYAPGGRGLSGGSPGAASSNVIVRESDIRGLFDGGRVPLSIEELSGAAIEVQEPKAFTAMGNADVLVGVVAGGAGYGDPLRRDPQAVLRDVGNGLVSEEMGRSVYGVAISGGELDEAATRATRAEARNRRLADGRPVQDGPALGKIAAGRVLHPVVDTIDAVEVDGRRRMRCSVCEQDLGGYGDDYKQATLVRELPLTAVNPGNALCRLDEFVAREFCCPGCGTAVALDIQRPGEPVQDESRFVASALGEAG